MVLNTTLSRLLQLQSKCASSELFVYRNRCKLWASEDTRGRGSRGRTPRLFRPLGVSLVSFFRPPQVSRGAVRLRTSKVGTGVTGGGWTPGARRGGRQSHLLHRDMTHGTASPDCLQNGQGWWWFGGSMYIGIYGSPMERVWVCRIQWPIYDPKLGGAGVERSGCF